MLLPDSQGVPMSDSTRPNVTLTQNTILLRSTDILESDLGTEKVMMSIERGRYYGLNEIGKEIHDACDGKVTLGQVAEVLHEKFEVDGEECKTKVVDFATRLVRQGLLVLPDDRA